MVEQVEILDGQEEGEKYSITIYLTIILPYSQKYWQSLNSVIWPQTTLLVDFNLVVERHLAKLPNFPAILYFAITFSS